MGLDVTAQVELQNRVHQFNYGRGLQLYFIYFRRAGFRQFALDFGPARLPASASRRAMPPMPAHGGQGTLAILAVNQAENERQHDRTSLFDRGLR